MTTYIFLCFLVLTTVCVSVGNQASNTVYTYGLPELTQDILQKIKTATGQPININRFIPIFGASSKGYEVIEPQPYTKSSKYLKASNNEKLDGGSYHSKKKNKGTIHEKDHYYESGDKKEKGEDSLKHQYGSESGKHHKYHEGRFTQKNYHKGNKGKKGGKYKKGRKRGKFHVEKGFRDIYHKDEEKKSDYFWNNQHEEGKWIHYGLVNKKTKKSKDKGDEGKKSKDKKEESSYEKKEKKCTKCKTR